MCAFTAAPAWAGDGGFIRGEEIPIPGASSVGIGDFNGDGRPDLAVTTSEGRVRVRLGAPGRAFMPAPDVVVGGRPHSVVIANLDADRHDDLVVANFETKDVSVRLGRGDGTFIEAPDIDLTAYPRAVVVGDFNADTREDLVIPTTDPAGAKFTAEVRLGTGDGRFGEAGDVQVAAGPLAVGDFNGDAREDLVFGDLRGNPHPAGRVLIGGGDGTFAPGAAVDLPAVAPAPRGWAVGDFDGDRRHDVAVAVPQAHVVSVRLGAGDGSLGRGPDVPTGGKFPNKPAVGDFDADGNEDVAVANSDSNSVAVLLGDGAGGFRAAPDVGVGDFPVDIAVADLDGDGNDDLAVANVRGDSLSVRYGTGDAAHAGNLLVNGGFEGAGAAARQTEAPEIPGWQRTGGMTYARYGLPSHAYFPSRLAAPRLAGGRSFLWGGASAASGGVTTAFQTVDVSADAAPIDAGRAIANLSAYLGGGLAFGDAMTARAEFLGASGAALGSFAIGPVTPADRNRLTTLVRRAGRAPVPAGTRRIRVTLTSTDVDKSYSSATADNVRLTLVQAPAGPGGTPGPGPGGPGADRTRPAIGRLSLAPAAFAVARRSTARAAGRGTTIRYTLSEPARVTLRFQRAARGRRAGGACRPVTPRGRRGRPCRRYVAVGSLRRAGTAGANRIAFSGRIGRRALRRGSYRLVVSAVDAAGNRAVPRRRGFRIVR